MKKILLVTVVSFVVVGVLSFLALNVMSWAVKGLEKHNRPDHSQVQPSPKAN
jgi:hypothetical protein